jgi:(p)ppGpp synthase/HD superfamily hydrolase
MMIGNAIKIAVNAHYGQQDKGGKPYILHPLKVMHYLKTDDEELMCIAVLHDIIEDTKVTYHDLESIGMSERVISAVRVLTKQPGQTFEEYKAAVKSNRDAIKVKMSDLRHNSDLRRLKGVTEKDIERMEKYAKFYKELQESA